jgi:uncharacterized membrane protein (DUF106 family)
MENQMININRNEFSKLVVMLQEIQDKMESLELANDPELMKSLEKSKEEIANGEVVDFDDL